jgi:glycine/sarcosine N-methyltransferase
MVDAKNNQKDQGMTRTNLRFYEELAAHYHLIFDDWNAAIERQAQVLGPLIHSHAIGNCLRVLDCSCGIGTQSLGFAKLGYSVLGSDMSPAAIKRAKKEASNRDLSISFRVSDMTSLAEIAETGFDVVATLDNALPHLDANELMLAIRAMASRIKPGGLLLASIRDYDALKAERPTIQEPAFYGRGGDNRIVHQVWDWTGLDRYVVHLYITIHAGREWTVHHFVSEYRCVLRDELSNVLRSSGFSTPKWFMPAESGFYQPVMLATKDH